jgi:uncharacterized Tic20 family protein
VDASPPPIPPIPPVPGPGPGPGPGLDPEARNWAVLAHVAGLAVGLVATPGLAFLGPLVVHLLRRDRDPFSARHARAALNFQLTVLLLAVALGLLSVPLVIVGVLTLGLGLVALAVLLVTAAVLWLIVPVLGALAANRGEPYDPPFTLTLVRGA